MKIPVGGSLDVAIYTLIGCLAGAIVGFVEGYEAGSPIHNITEIVWIEHNDLKSFFDWECRMKP